MSEPGKISSALGGYQGGVRTKSIEDVMAQRQRLVNAINARSGGGQGDVNTNRLNYVNNVADNYLNNISRVQYVYDENGKRRKRGVTSQVPAYAYANNTAVGRIAETRHWENRKNR